MDNLTTSMPKKLGFRKETVTPNSAQHPTVNETVGYDGQVYRVMSVANETVGYDGQVYHVMSVANETIGYDGQVKTAFSQ